VEGEGEGLLVRQDDEMLGLQHVTEVPHGLIDRKELPVINTVLLLCRVQILGEEREGLPDVLHTLLEDGTHGGG